MYSQSFDASSSPPYTRLSVSVYQYVSRGPNYSDLEYARLYRQTDRLLLLPFNFSPARTPPRSTLSSSAVDTELEHRWRVNHQLPNPLPTSGSKDYNARTIPTALEGCSISPPFSLTFELCSLVTLQILLERRSGSGPGLLRPSPKQHWRDYDARYELADFSVLSCSTAHLWRRSPTAPRI